MIKGLPEKDLYYVFTQLNLFFLYVLPIRLSGFLNALTYLKPVGLILGISGAIILVLSLLQLNTNLSPFPSPKKTSSLVQTGLYKFMRHPIYGGIILIGLGFGFYSFSSWKLLITFTLIVFFYFKSRYEEKLLIHKFPEYAEYKKSTGRFFTFRVFNKGNSIFTKD